MDYGTHDPYGPTVIRISKTHITKELILKASNQTGWNQSRTARLLNLKRDKLRYRMKNFNLEDENEVPTQ